MKEMSKSPRELSFDAIEGVDQYVDIIIQKVHHVTQLFQASDLSSGNKAFRELVDILDLFIQLIDNTKVHILSDLDGDHELKKSIKEQEVHLLTLLRNALPAKEKNDITMLCDLLEYELVDNLNMWKTIITPQIKKLRSR